MQQYTVHWESGNLGVWLQETKRGEPVVCKLVRPLPSHFAALDIHEGSVGDLLLSIGGHVVGNDYNAAIRHLKDAVLPLDLVFLNRREEMPHFEADLHAREYSFEWQANTTLGISFAKDPQTLLTIISNINFDIMPQALKDCNPKIGDIVSSIGNVNVTKAKFHEVLEMLPKVEKPVTLSFLQHQAPSHLKSKPQPSTYTIEFNGDKLGIIFVHGENNRPIVKESTIHKIASAGDSLVSIGDKDTLSIGFSGCMEKLKQVKHSHPITLTFARPQPPITPPSPPPPSASSSIKEYVVEYHGGRLGLVLVAGPSANSHPLVEKVTDASTAPGLELAVHGDELIAIDDVDTSTLGFDGTVAKIKQVHGQLTLLKFRKKKEEVTAAGLLLTLVGALFI